MRFANCHGRWRTRLNRFTLSAHHEADGPPATPPWNGLRFNPCIVDGDSLCDRFGFVCMPGSVRNGKLPMRCRFNALRIAPRQGLLGWDIVPTARRTVLFDRIYGLLLLFWEVG